ncbi:MAG TPA: isoaspartyl peptidase/L-asparaginase [Thermoleophilaceae bacterium]
MREPVVAVHGGAGHGPRGGEAAAARHRAALQEAVEAARGALRGGGSALDAAVAAVVALEDCPLFNAGRGAVETEAGEFELDAAVMHGPERRAGAVAAVAGVRNPVLLARAVMETTPHVLLVGGGARALAEREGLELAGPEWFAERAPDHVPGDAGPAPAGDAGPAPAAGAEPPAHGTVGAVVLDRSGRLAAATSTGGVRGQMPGRVGDTSLPGAGTYADERVAVSATGQGEAMMRTVAAHEVAALVRHAGLGLEEAAARALADVEPLGGGGLIALDAGGALAMPFNTPAMFRAWARGDGAVRASVG